MSLKEIKARIASVKNTRKTTSAMKMVSSVKLRKAQQGVQNALPYAGQLDDMLACLVRMPGLSNVPLLNGNSVSRTVIVAVSSDSSLCGSFNTNIIKHTRELYGRLKAETGCEPVLFTVGQKITEHFRKSEIPVRDDFAFLIAGRKYADTALFADRLTGMFLSGEAGRVILTYQHFKSAGSQQIEERQLLPFAVPDGADGSETYDCILEPTAGIILDKLMPAAIRMRLYSVLLDSYCAEQAARVIAMQAATDNADNLIAELTLQYNKLRQQAITNELLDLAGGQIEN